MVLNAVASDKPPTTPPASNTKRTVPPGTKPATKPTQPAAKKSTQSYTIREIEKWFLRTYVMVGTALAVFKPALADQIIISAPKCAESMAHLCAEDHRIRKVIETMMTTGVYSAVITAHLPILLVWFAEYRTDDENARINQQTLMGFARMLSQDGGLFAEPEPETADVK